MFCLIEDESLRADSLRLIQDLRAADCVVDYSLTPAKPDKQFKRAVENKAANTVKLERSPAGELFVRLRNLRTREEKTVTPAEAAALFRAPCV